MVNEWRTLGGKVISIIDSRMAKNQLRDLVISWCYNYIDK